MLPLLEAILSKVKQGKIETAIDAQQEAIPVSEIESTFNELRA